MMMPTRVWLAPHIGGRLPPGLSGLAGANPGVEAQIRQTAAAYGVDPNLAVAVAQHESGLVQSRVSSAGAIGIFQLMPKTAAGLGVDPYDPAQNIAGGVSYLAQMLQRYNGDTAAALAAYNEGPGAYDSGHMYTETRNYVAGILADYTPTPAPSPTPQPPDSPPPANPRPYTPPAPYEAPVDPFQPLPDGPPDPPPPSAPSQSSALPWVLLGGVALVVAFNA